MSEYITREDLAEHCNMRHAPADKNIDVLFGKVDCLTAKLDKLIILGFSILATFVFNIVQERVSPQSPQPVKIELTIDKEGDVTK